MIINPKISVIVCTYNQEQYIGQTLESLLHQDFEYGYEILVGDDCSKDGTRQIIQSYIDRYPDLVIPVYPKHNLGVSKNIINLINHARGEIISICDGDDYWLREDVLQMQVDVFRANPKVGMVCAKAKRFIQEKGDYEGTLGYAGAEDLMTMLRDNCDVAAPTIAFRTALMRQCIADSEWYIDQNYFYDTIMAYWFACNSSVKFIDEELSAYRILPHSAGHSILPEKEAEYERRYFAVKWHFILTHPDICGEELYQVLMKDYDKRTASTANRSAAKVRASKAYRLGNTIINPLRKIKI